MRRRPWTSTSGVTEVPRLRGVDFGEGGTAEDVASMVTFLAGPEAAYVTGTEFPVDGGHAACPGGPRPGGAGPPPAFQWLAAGRRARPRRADRRHPVRGGARVAVVARRPR
ncbi:SDR family oxidoreductase [Streptomyces sp. H49]|uniref:SDR family oxidoreductase n=1 Tax=Streptomyces sp. H49 TaxID=3444117 RepID=UPI003F4A91FA